LQAPHDSSELNFELLGSKRLAKHHHTFVVDYNIILAIGYSYMHMRIRQPLFVTYYNYT